MVTMSRIVLLLALLSVLAYTPANAVLIPGEGEYYHGVYPGGQTGAEDDITLEDVEAYETTVGKTASWVYFSNNWYQDRAFPLQTVTWIRGHGATPYIRLMLRGSADNLPNRPFQLSKIVRGKFDLDLRAWARAAHDFGSPLIVEYGTEMNGFWFPWNGKWNGGGGKRAYGDKKQFDGPERFRDAYRHIIDVIRSEGADNITWVFHVNNADAPEREWNHFENYYPGDNYVDWLGLSVYGALTPLEDSCGAFRDSMDAAYARLDALQATKPVFVLEFGVTNNNPFCDQAVWAHEALTDLSAGRWPRVKGFSWWNETWQNDNKPAHDTNMRVNDNPALANEFKELVGKNDKVLGHLLFKADAKNSI